MKNVLVTGGAGFVGRHLAKALLEKKWNVTVVDSLVKGSGAISPYSGWPLFNPLDFDNFNFKNQDCRSFFLESKSNDFDYIFHLAAVVGGRLTIENDPLAVATDLAIDADMWRWAKNSSVSRVINFSSSAAYPVDSQNIFENVIKLDEKMIDFKNTIGLPDLTYGWAKLTSEYLGRIAWERYGVKNISYRPFSGYGPDQDLTYPFTSICKRAIENIGSSRFSVWGTGKQSRDFIHIDDCVRGVLTTFDKIDNGEALNLSTGIATSFIEFAKLATSYLNYEPEIHGDESKPTGVHARVGATDKQIEMNFIPEISFKSGVAQCIDYFMKFKNSIETH